MKRLIFILFFASCGAPTVKMKLDEPLVSEVELPTTHTIGNQGIALLRDGTIYLARVDAILGEGAVIVEDYYDSSGNVTAVLARRELAADEVPEAYRDLANGPIHLYDGADCTSRVDGFAYEVYVEFPNTITYEELENRLEELGGPVLLTAQKGMDGEDACYATMGLASRESIPPDTYFDPWDYTQEQEILKLLPTVKRESVLFDPLAQNDVIVSIEHYESDCSQPEKFSLTVHRFRKKDGKWTRQELFHTDDDDGIVYLSNSSKGIVIGTETGVYHNGKWETWMPSRLQPLPPDPNCSALRP